MTKEQKRQLQEKVIQFELLRTQAQVYQEQLTLLLDSLAELGTTKAALDELGTVGEGVLVPLGPDVYVRAGIAKRDAVLVHVGANVIVRKSAAEGRAIVQGHIERLEKNRDSVQGSLKKVTEALESLQMDIQALAASLKATERPA